MSARRLGLAHSLLLLGQHSLPQKAGAGHTATSSLAPVLQEQRQLGKMSKNNSGGIIMQDAEADR